MKKIYLVSVMVGGYLAFLGSNSTAFAIWDDVKCDPQQNCTQVNSADGTAVTTSKDGSTVKTDEKGNVVDATPPTTTAATEAAKDTSVNDAETKKFERQGNPSAAGTPSDAGSSSSAPTSPCTPSDEEIANSTVKEMLSHCKPGRVITSKDGDYTIEKGARQKVVDIANQIILAGSILAVGAIVYSAILYTIAAGDEERVKKAKGSLKFGIIGFVMMLLSFPLVNAIIRLLYTTSGG